VDCVSDGVPLPVRVTLWDFVWVCEALVVTDGVLVTLWDFV
jgi:hypothetical protein